MDQQQIQEHLTCILDFQNTHGETLSSAKQALTRQTQLIMKLLEVQVKYGINVVNPEDEVTAFDLENCLEIQNRLDAALLALAESKEKIPSIVQSMQTGQFQIMKKTQLEDLQCKIDNVNERCGKMWQKLQVFQRNEKYGFQGFKALQALNPYLVNDNDRLKKNERYLLEADGKAK